MLKALLAVQISVGNFNLKHETLAIRLRMKSKKATSTNEMTFLKIVIKLFTNQT